VLVGEVDGCDVPRHGPDVPPAMLRSSTRPLRSICITLRVSKSHSYMQESLVAGV
jgi:hypothetical protein